MLNSTSGEIIFVGDFNCRNSNGQVEMDRRTLYHCNGTVSGIWQFGRDHRSTGSTFMTLPVAFTLNRLILVKNRME